MLLLKKITIGISQRHKTGIGHSHRVSKGTFPAQNKTNHLIMLSKLQQMCHTQH